MRDSLIIVELDDVLRETAPEPRGTEPAADGVLLHAHVVQPDQTMDHLGWKALGLGLEIIRLGPGLVELQILLPDLLREGSTPG